MGINEGKFFPSVLMKVFSSKTHIRVCPTVYLRWFTDKHNNVLQRAPSPWLQFNFLTSLKTILTRTLNARRGSVHFMKM